MPTSLPVPVGPETPRLLVQTFGPLAITQVDPLTGTHTRIEQARLYGLSAGSNLTLLKTLLCQPARFAKVDQLLEWLWPESPYGTARERLKDVVSGLRVFLRPPNSEAKIVYHVPSLPKRDSGFRLESYPFLWADADAFSWLVTHAAACDHLRQDAWPWWERAFLLASRGPFLVEDPYSEWATKRRREIDGQYRQCVRRLVVGWLQRGQEAQALQVLRTYWQSHPEDEDLVRPLLKLLADQGLYQEAEQVYECLRLFLEELGSVPDERTVQLRDYARTRPLLSEDLLVHQPALPAIQEPLLLGPDASSGVTGPAAGRSLVVQPTSFEVTCEPASPTLDALGALLAGALSPFQVSAEDCATYFGEKQVQLLSWLDQWVGQAASCTELQLPLHSMLVQISEIGTRMHEEQSRYSRRQLLTMLAALPLAGSLTMNTFPSLQGTETFLPRCAASLVACQHLMKGQEFFYVEQILSRMTQHLLQLAQQISVYQATAAHLASQSHTLANILSSHRLHWSESMSAGFQAIGMSKLTQDYNLRVTSHVSLATRFFYLNKLSQSLAQYQEALPLLQKSSPLAQSNFLVKYAASLAQNGQEKEALTYLEQARTLFPDEEQQDASFLFADFGASNLSMWEGLTLLALARRGEATPQAAWEAFAAIEQFQPEAITSERSRVENLNHQAEAALVLEDRDLFATCLTAGAQGARQLKSPRRLQEGIHSYRLAREQWPHEDQIQRLADLFVSAV